uniref:Putative conserved secreted protein n=1 Tax=Corethrella appendiculata TaxID=1370023 RepID=U5ED22_9DIPT
MRIFAILLSFLSISVYLNTIKGWPLSNPEVVNSLIFTNSEAQPGQSNLRDIPQWHCLRYFKHDIHLMRRCRNYRLHMLRRPIDTNLA